MITELVIKHARKTPSLSASSGRDKEFLRIGLKKVLFSISGKGEDTYLLKVESW